jgi:hypothetical protein
MKALTSHNIFVIGIVALCLTACKNNNVTQGRTLLVKDLASEHPDWKVSHDTITIDTVIDFTYSNVPVTISWVPATDPSGGLCIAYFRLERSINDTTSRITDASSVYRHCPTESESHAKIRYGAVIFFGRYYEYSKSGEYSFNGELGWLSGDGVLHTGLKDVTYR